MIDKKPSILIVDDEQTNINFLSNFLQNDYEIKVAIRGEVALKILKNFEIDLILLDIQMPEMDGFTLAKHIKKNKETEQIPFIFLTGNSDGESISKGFKLGAKDYITKPFNTEELKIRIQNHITTHLQHLQIIEQQKMLIQQTKVAAMGEMTTMLAHQWRQPINAIGVLVQELKIKNSMNKLDNAEFEKIYEQIQKLIIYLSDTINSFKDFFKQDNTQTELNMVNIIEQVYGVVNIKLKAKEISYEINKDETNNYLIFGNPNSLKQILVSILNNAIEAFEDKHIEEKFINTTITRNSNTITILIEDNAGGIDNKILSTLFEPYSSTKLEKNGSGLGLYMSLMVMEKHFNGSIKGYNNNNGAVFELEFPTEDK